MGCNGDAERIFLYSRVRFLSVSLSVDNTMIWNPNLNAVCLRISLRRLVCKNEFLGGACSKGGLIQGGARDSAFHDSLPSCT